MRALILLCFTFVIISGTYQQTYAKVLPSDLPDSSLWDYRGATFEDAVYCVYQPFWQVNAVKTGSGYTLNPVARKIFRLNTYDEVNDVSFINYGQRGGDYLITKIIDIRKSKAPYISFLYQRGGLTGYSNTGKWDQRLYGPEIRVIDKLRPNPAVREPDQLLVELISADSAHLGDLINPKEPDWNVHPSRYGLPPVTGNPALCIFGGGGYRRGFLENDKDSSLTYDEGLRCDYYDVGNDDRFERAYVFIPEQFRKNGFIRVRFRVDAEKNGDSVNVWDDNDDFFLDDIKVVKDGKPDLSLNSMYIQNPYTIINYNPKIDIPLYANVTAVYPAQGDSFYLKIRIKPKNQPYWPLTPDEPGFTGEDGYSKILSFPVDSFIKIIYLPSIKLSKFKNDFLSDMTIFQVWTVLTASNGNSDMTNDTLLTEFSVNFGKVIAYDSPSNKNNYPEFSGKPGSGLNLWGFSISSDLTDSIKTKLPGSGRIAIRFELSDIDTVYGYQAFWGSHNLNTDYISFAIIKDGGQPGPLFLSNSLISGKRGIGAFSTDTIWDDYVTYLLPQPLILPPGEYYMTAEQKSSRGFCLGASAYNMGMITTSVYRTASSDSGHNSRNFNAERTFRRLITNGRLQYWVNNTIFNFENTLNSGNWDNFNPYSGGPAYAHLDHLGRIKGYNTYTRGSFVPMLRLYMDGSHYTWNSVNESNQNKSISISPNPASDYITVSVGANSYSPESIKIFDVFGREEHPPTPSTSGEGVRIDVSSLSPGVYFVRVGEKVSKFLKVA